MIDYITKAAEHFIEHQIRAEYASVPVFTSANSVSTYIEILIDSQTQKVFLTYDKELLQRIATIYIMEENCDDKTLEEMALETTNMIVGSAKTLAAEDECHFNIKTPFIDDNSCKGNSVVIAVEGKEIAICMDNI